MTRTLGIDSGDEVGLLAKAYDSFTVRMRQVIQDVQDSAMRVTEALALISSASANATLGHGSVSKAWAHRARPGWSASLPPDPDGHR